MSILPTYDDQILSADINTYGYSLSMQISYKFKLSCSGIYLEPKAKITYSNLVGGHYDVGGMLIDSMPSKNFVTWLGARIGVDKLNEYGKTDGIYLEAGWIHDTNPSAVYIVEKADEEITEVTLGANRFEVGVGFEFVPLGQSSFTMEYKYAQGRGIIEPLKLKISGSVYF